MTEDVIKQIEADAKRSELIGGRATDATMQKHMVECIEAGLGYRAAIPKLIELGYVKYGRCTISYRQYEYARIRYSSLAVLRIQMDKSLVNWAKEHEAEVIQFIKDRAAEDGND